MSMNGSGVYVVNSAGQPVVAATLITAAAFNAFTADIGTAMSTAIMKDGQTTITQNIPFNAKKITGLGAGTARTDAASLATIQDATGVYVATVGGTADAITLTPSPAITAYAAGQTFRFLASGANTTSVTVAISGLTAKAITKNGAIALVAGDIPSGAMATITYDGTRFCLGTLGAATYGASLDSVFRVVGSSDDTKKVAFEVDGLTTATTRTITVPDRSFTIGPTLTAEQVSTSGTVIDFTGIPAGTRRITIMLLDVSTNGTSHLLVQIGDSGGIDTTSYSTAYAGLVNAGAVAAALSTTGWIIAAAANASAVITGTFVLNLEESTGVRWMGTGTMARTDTAAIYTTTGVYGLSAMLDRVRITTVNGTDAFDAGVINISYE